MGADLTTINAMLKKVYTKETIERLENVDAPTRKAMRASSKNIGGAGLHFNVNSKGNQRGQGSQNELEALRTPDVQTTVEARIKPKVFTHVCRLSGLSLEAAQGGEEAYADNLTYQTDEGFVDSEKELNAQLFRDGTGKLGQVAGAVSGSTTVTFDNGVPTHFRVGMFVDVINGSSVKQIDSIEVSSVDIANNQITLASSQSCDDNSWIYRENTADNAPTDGKELAGLPLVTDDGTLAASYENVTRANVPGFKGITIDAGSANLSNDLLQRAISRQKVLHGGKCTKVCSNTSQMRKYLDIVTPMKQFNGADAKMDSGYVPMPTWNGKEWIEDTDCGFGDLYLFNPNYLEMHYLKKLHLDDQSGSILKWDPGFDGFVCYLKEYSNAGTRHPGKAAVRIKSLAEPTF